MNFKPSLVPWVGSLLCGICLVVAFEPFDGWWLGWVALSPAWIALRGCAKVRHHPLRYGYPVGLLFMLGGFWWTGAVTIVGLLLTAFALAIFPALWFLLLARTVGMPCHGQPLSFTRLVVCALLAAAFWVTLESLRSGFMRGFIWNDLGVSQVPSTHFRQLAALGGGPLLTLVLATCGVLWGEALWCMHRRWWRPAGAAVLAAVTIMAGSWLYGWHRLALDRVEVPRTSLSYACIQPNIPELPYHTAAHQEIVRREIEALTIEQTLSAQALATQPDLLVWPEAVTTQRLLPHSLLRQAVDHIEVYFHGSLLLGAEEVEDGKLYNTAYLFGPGEPEPQRYHKVYLVVLGEYVPGADLFPWLAKWWGRNIPVAAGTEPGKLVLREAGLSVAPLICFEDTQPTVVNAAAARHPDFFVTLVNAGWFAGPYADWCLRQHLENAVLRCVEHDRPMLRCSDTGITCEIDALGGITARLSPKPGSPLETQGILSGRLFLKPWRETLYEKLGDWIGGLSRMAAMSCCLLAVLRRSRCPLG